MSDQPARRVRTQAERDADGTTWRRTADSRPGYATYPTTPPGNPSWWRHDPGRGLSPIARVMAGLDHPGPPPVDGEKCAKWCGFCHLGTGGPEQLPPISYADQLIARHGEPMRDAIDQARIRYEADKERARNPRRRWWHRYTRRTV